MGWTMGVSSVLTIRILKKAGSPAIHCHGFMETSFIIAHALTHVQAISLCKAQNNSLL